ncbi:MAG: polysaccharide pyruvyl transferase family protein, partial [Verrucomicrobia bacterium]|nr:polysaccharide pyruvyl transferase family protein [Verrucomicrobiota bacterium]
LAMNRRHFLASTAAAGVAATALRSPLLAAAAKSGRPPRILLRSSWQSVNIGDIGHTPGALRLIEKYFPEAEMTVWHGPLGHGSDEFLRKGFPRLKFVSGAVGTNGRPSNPALAAAWEENDFLLHGSGSGFGARAQLAAWHRATNKPFGIFGVSDDPVSGFGEGREPEGGSLAALRAAAAQLPATRVDAETRWIIERSSFMFTRETLTRDFWQAQGVRAPILEFGPDSQLGMSDRDDARGMPYLKAKGLVAGRYICVVPRLRYTPYYKMGRSARVALDEQKDAINARWAERDHAKLRDLIVRYVRATGNKVLACPEVIYQIDVAKELLVDPLPPDVKKNVVWRDTFWLPDEAASVYAQAEALVCMDCHSPLIAYHHGTPAFYVRNATDTWKGQMYADIGVSDWLFEADETSGEELWSRLAPIHADPARARARVKTVMAGVEKLQRRMVGALQAAVARG